MKIKDEIRGLILDRFAWLTTTISISLPVLLSLLSTVQDKPDLLFLGLYLFISLFIFVNSIYILVSRKSKPDILIARSIESIRKDNIEEKMTAKYPILQPYAKKGLLFSTVLILISFFTPSFHNITSLVNSETPTLAPTITPTQIVFTPVFTPTVTVIYKSPMEMNLQPSDVPGLSIAEVQDPSAEPFIPEATDQSQLAYTDNSKKDYIETNVLIVPTKTNRTPSDLFDLTVAKRRPSMEKLSGEQPVQIGEQAYIFEINDKCGSGYVLVAIRSNIITIVIGCGENIKIALIEQIGKSIDGHIVAPKEGFKLTPEEESVAGKYKYSRKATITNGSCIWTNTQSKTEELVVFYSISFLQNGILQDYGGRYYYRAGTNTYITYINDEGHAKGPVTINITMKGFTVLAETGCTIYYEYSQIE